MMQYARSVTAYHGCDRAIAAKLLAGGKFKPSENDYDWLGHGIYFWEFGPDRAYRFAKEKRRRWRKISTPAVVGALIHLGNCFDLLDTRFTADLREAFPKWRDALMTTGADLPVNTGTSMALRKRDCAVLNWYLDLAEQAGTTYDTVRCAYLEGPPAFDGSGIHMDTHIQIAVRNPACILGVFNPRMGL